MSGDTTSPREPRCSFCGEPVSARQMMIAGPDVHICDECVELSAQIILDARRSSATEQLAELAAARANEAALPSETLPAEVAALERQVRQEINWHKSNGRWASAGQIEDYANRLRDLVASTAPEAQA